MVRTLTRTAAAFALGVLVAVIAYQAARIEELTAELDPAPELEEYDRPPLRALRACSECGGWHPRGAADCLAAGR